MDANSREKIAFRIHRIETLQFAILIDTIDSEELTISSGFGFGIDPDDCLLRSTFKYEFQSEQKPALILEVAVDFAIEPESFSQNLKNEANYIIPKHMANHLAMITVGTARGILHEKTNGTDLNKYLIPTIDITESIREDVVFDAE